MARIKSGYYFLILLFALVPMQAFAERPLENASYSEGMKAIKEMHVLNSLGLAGELIGIYKALNQASYAAAILHNRKWRPGEDDLSWVDDPDYGKIRHDPFAGLRPSDKRTVKRMLGNLQYLNGLLESENLNSAQEKDALLGIQELVKALKRTLASYPDHYARLFPNKVKSGRRIGEIPDFVGMHKLAFTCTSGCTGVWRHTMSVTSMDQKGNFSGTGYYDGDHGYTWNVKGQLSGDTVNFKMVYTGKNRGYTSTNSGKISSNGAMTGTGFSSTGQKHSWSN